MFSRMGTLLAVYKAMQKLREGGVYLGPDGTMFAACPEADGSHVLYILEDTEAEGGAADEPGGQRRKFELFRADEKGRLFRYGRLTDWRVGDLDLTDTGQTVRVC
jgi:hypothetical protein